MQEAIKCVDCLGRKVAVLVAGLAAISLHASFAVAQAQPVAFDVPATAFFANTGYLPFVVAQHAKIYERAGLKPNIINVAGGGTALRAFTSSDAPIGVEGVPSTLPAIQNGGNYRIVGQTSRQSDTWVVAKANSGIAGVKDLRGKKIGVTSPGSTLEAIAKGALRKAGLAQTDAQIVYLGTIADALVGLEKGLVDVIAGAGQVQLHYHVETKKDWTLIGRGSDFVPLIDAVIVAKVDTIKNRPDLIRNFMRATLEGRNHLSSHPRVTELADVAMKWQRITSDELRPAVVKMLENFGRQGYAEQFFGDLSVDMKQLEEVARALVASGTLKEMPTNWGLYVDTSFAPAKARN